MTAKWGICVFLVGVLALSSGCRTPQPNLKPDTSVELYNVPPPGTYNSAAMPKQAFSAPTDPSKFALDSKAGGVMPTRGSMGGAGAMR